MNFFNLKKAALLLGDIALMYLALYITLLIRYNGAVNSELWKQHLLPFTLVFIIWIVVFFINNLYSVLHAKNDFRFYGYLVQNLVINTLIGFTFFYLIPASLSSLRPFRVLIILVILYALLFLLWRKIFYLFTSSSRLSSNLMLIGINREAAELAEHIVKNPLLGYSLKVIVNPDQIPIPESLKEIPVKKDLSNLTDLIAQHKIQTIVTVSSQQFSAEVSRYLFQILHLGLSYHTFPEFYEQLTGKVPVASLERNWFFENILQGNKQFYEASKRAIDIFSAGIFGILSLVLVPFIILGIKLSSPGPILFKQIRTGQSGKPFLAMKFRTMVINAESNGPQWASKNDSRVTKFGKLLRKTRLDEIPQFFNIIIGDMSLIGPRPERPEFVQMLTAQIPFYTQRLLVKPGLSGWAQINFPYGDSVDDAMTKLQYDLFYIKNRSFILDISIILKTIRIVLGASFGQ